MSLTSSASNEPNHDVYAPERLREALRKLHEGGLSDKAAIDVARDWMTRKGIDVGNVRFFDVNDVALRRFRLGQRRIAKPGLNILWQALRANPAHQWAFGDPPKADSPSEVQVNAPHAAQTLFAFVSAIVEIIESCGFRVSGHPVDSFKQIERPLRAIGGVDDRVCTKLQEKDAVVSINGVRRSPVRRTQGNR